MPPRRRTLADPSAITRPSGLGSPGTLTATPTNFNAAIPRPPTRAGGIQDDPDAPPPPPPAPPPPPPTAPRRSSLLTNTMELGPDRLDNPDQGSPKDIYLSAARYYGFNESQQLLADLQSGVWGEAAANFYQGWTANGDKLLFTGDRNTLAPEWGGVDSFDTIGAHDSVNNTAAGWRWGVGEGGGTWRGADAGGNGGGTGTGDGGTPFASSAPAPSPGGGGGGVPGFSGGGGVGTDGAIEEIIRQLISGRGALGTELEGDTTTAIRNIINQGGALNEGRLNQRIEGARERTEQSRRGQTDQLMAELASRGLSGTGGQEAEGLTRVGERVGEDFSTALRDIEVAESQAADARLMDALSLATGMGRDQAQTLLGAIGAGNQRQAVLAQVAIAQLENNTRWNMFLAQHGLDRDRLMLEVQNGRFENILPILSLFLQTIQTGRGGTTPPADD